MMNPQEYHAAVKAIFPRVVTAKDGRMVTLRYGDDDEEDT